MTFGGSPFAESTLAGTVFEPVVAPTPPPIDPIHIPGAEVVIDPFTIEISGVAYKGLVDSLSIDAELGRQGSARVTLININTVPLIGEPVRILYYDEVLFAGALDRLKIESNNVQTYITYDMDFTDHSYLLYRRKITRTFSNQSVATIANTIIVNDLTGDGVTIGNIDNLPVIPEAKADGVSVFEFLNEIAQSVGALFYIDHQKKLYFNSTSAQTSPTSLDENNIEKCTILFDRETYRNRQTTRVTGTTTQQNEQALSILVTRSNEEQIATQRVIEGTGGVYNDYVSVTHPTSNDTIQLTYLGVAYNKIGLAVTGSIRRSISIRTRQYGYKVGQFVTVTVPHLGITGQWVIQRASLREESGRFLVYTLELNQSSLIRRAQQLWLEVVRKGTMAIMPPSRIYNSKITYEAAGSYQFTVPVGITEVQISCFGAGGGGGGGAKSEWPGYGGIVVAKGANGGNGCLTITILRVTPGEILYLVVGAAGTGGASQYRFESFTNANGSSGTSGGQTTASRAGNFTICQAGGGEGGLGGMANARFQQSQSWPAGRDGTGLFGQVITVGGAANGGAGGAGAGPSAGSNGGAGKIFVEW